MSIATQISRITSLRDRIRTKLINLGIMQPIYDGGGGGSASKGAVNDLLDCTEALEDLTNGTVSITTKNQYDVLGNGKRYAQVDDPNLTSANIASGVTILGVTGTHSGSTPSQQSTIGGYEYGGSSNPSIIYAPDGYLFSEVRPVLANNPTLVDGNIKSGVTIMGVTGTYSAGNQQANKQVVLGSNAPTTVYPDTGYSSMQQVELLINQNVIKAENIRTGVSILGVPGNLTPTYGNTSYTPQNEEYDGTTDGIYQLTFELPSDAYGKTCLAFYISANSSSTDPVLIPRTNSIISSITYNSYSGATFNAIYISPQPSVTPNWILSVKQNSNPSTVYNSNNKTWFAVDVNAGASSWEAAKNIKYELVYIYY